MAILVKVAHSVVGCVRMRTLFNFGQQDDLPLAFIYAYVHTQLEGIFLV